MRLHIEYRLPSLAPRHRPFLACWLLVVALFAGACATAPRGFVRGPQGLLHVDDGGHGSAVPLLFVHGNGANLEQWRAVLEHERLTRRAVAFDLRGMGKSAVPANGDYSVAAMAADVEAVAKALGLKRFVLIGHSYGSHVVAEYAARHPERVAAAVHVDGGANVRMPDEAAAKFAAAVRKNKDGVAAQWFAPILKDAQPSTRQTVLASVHDTNTEAFIGALDGTRRVDLGPLLDAYHGPRLAIVAKPIEGPNSLHVQYKQVPARAIDGVSHWIMLDKPAEFEAVLDAFLAEVR
jgi:pimeloyl-ACP methyl ester carboxylesterase